MRCAFCQNGDISTDKANGEVVDARTLATMAWLLRMEGCHNINWVGGAPSIHLHSIIEAIWLLAGDYGSPTQADVARTLPVKSDLFAPSSIMLENGTYRGDFNAPMLWNSNFFESEEAMRILRILIDVWLPDFKFGPGRCAVTLARTPRYWETVTGHLESIHGWGEDFTIRPLVMPNHVECCTYPVLDWSPSTCPRRRSTSWTSSIRTTSAIRAARNTIRATRPSRGARPRTRSWMPTATPGGSTSTTRPSPTRRPCWGCAFRR